MMRIRRVLPLRLLVCALLAWSGVLAAQERMIPEAEGRQVLAAADWEKAEVLEVTLDDHSYSPEQMRFERGRPYVLKLKNVGGEAHDMVGGSFFDAIVARMTNSRTGRVVTPYLRSIYVSPRQEIEIWFVAVRPGSYEFFCSLPGHRDAGMEGEVIIE